MNEICLKFRLLEQLNVTKNLEDIITLADIENLYPDDSRKKINGEFESLGVIKKKTYIKTSEY